MSTAAVILVVIVALIVVAALGLVVRSRALERKVERTRLLGEAFAHRDRAEAGFARARDLGSAAEAERKRAEEHAIAADEHARAAQQHAERATQLERGVDTAGRGASFHDREASEREDKLT